jgi:predicted DCC family thiol-disulfide oxidoreductase YuxK
MSSDPPESGTKADMSSPEESATTDSNTDESTSQDPSDTEHSGDNVGNSNNKSQAENPAWMKVIRDSYFSFDRRLLGFFRIYFGLLLFFDVLRRIPDAAFFYSDKGILSSHFSLFAPLIRPYYFSLLNAFSEPWQVKLVFLAIAGVYGMYIVGYRTKLAQILAVILYASVNARNHFLENGGCVVVGIVSVWTLFLPLGDRFSVDSVLKSLRNRKDFSAEALNDRSGIEPPRSLHVTLVFLVILLQIGAIYFFNYAHKVGPTWKNGEAFHLVLWQNRISTMWTEILRNHEPMWLSPLLAKLTLIVELGAPALLLIPFQKKYLRTLFFILVAGLHLNIALLMTLGPFSYVMIALDMLMVPPEVFDWIGNFLRKRCQSATVFYDPSSRSAHMIARTLARLDTFQMLNFHDIHSKEQYPESFAPKKVDGVLAVINADNKVFSDKDALFEIFRSLPGGFVWRYVVQLPPTSWAVSYLFNKRDHLAEVYAWKAGSTSAGVPYEMAKEPSPFRENVRLTATAMRESLVLLLLIAAVFQTSHDNWWLPKSLKRNQLASLAPVVGYLRMYQGWSMFAPDAPRDDGTIVVDGETVDGRHLDPFTGKPPDFEAPLHGPWYQSQFFCDYFLKIHFDGNRGYREEFKKYLVNWHRIEGRPSKDRIRFFRVYWVSNTSPPRGSRTPFNIRKTLLFSNH